MAGVKGRSGRPRLSAEEHRLRGTYRADRHGPLPPSSEDHAPLSREEPAIAPPSELSPAARTYWRYFAPLLASARALTPADRDTLADYCRACVAVTDRGRRLDRAYRHRTLDLPLVRVLDAQVRGWIEKKTRLATELGLTALSRTRLRWTGHHQRPGDAAPTLTDAPPKSRLAQLQEQAATLRRPLGVT